MITFHKEQIGYHAEVVFYCTPFDLYQNTFALSKNRVLEHSVEWTTLTIAWILSEKNNKVIEAERERTKPVVPWDEHREQHID